MDHICSPRAPLSSCCAASVDQQRVGRPGGPLSSLRQLYIHVVGPCANTSRARHRAPGYAWGPPLAGVPLAQAAAQVRPSHWSQEKSSPPRRYSIAGAAVKRVQSGDCAWRLGSGGCLHAAAHRRPGLAPDWGAACATGSHAPRSACLDPLASAAPRVSTVFCGHHGPLGCVTGAKPRLLPCVAVYQKKDDDLSQAVSRTCKQSTVDHLRWYTRGYIFTGSTR